jgi:voltage-dependent potassium channel beta subunit
MEYRRLGPTGLKLSVLGLGSWVTFGKQLDQGLARACMATAFEAGVNFFDNAESYGGGEAERIMGTALAQLGWAREDFVVSTKFFWGIRGGVNTRSTLNRKYLLAAIDPSLERLGLDFVDLVYCHRPDPDTPVEETVWAMHDVVESGRALYWGTSEWPVERIREAVDVADRHHLRRPVVEQPQYNLLVRERVEREYAGLYEDPGLGLTVWSPLASGVLTGKYLQGVPAGSRITLPGLEWLRAGVDDPHTRNVAGTVVALAGELGCSPAQLAIAWCARNQHVTSVITGASSVEQVQQNLKALDVLGHLDDALCGRLEAA